MPRPKKKKENKRKDNLFEYKATIGKNLDGTPIRKSFYSTISKAEAKKKADDYKAEKRASELVGISFTGGTTAFADWANKWLEIYKKPTVDENTYALTYLNAVNNHLIPYFGQADLKTIQAADIQAFYTLKKKSSQSLLSKLRLCLVGIFDAAIENDLCYKNPARSKTVQTKSERPKNEKRVYQPKEISQVYSHLNLKEALLALDTGARIGEICGFMWTDYNEKDKVLEVNRSIADKPGGGIKINPPKWDSYRPIPLNERACTLLDSIPRTSIYIFPNPKGEPQSPHSLRRKLSYRMKALPEGMERLTFHELRHTFGTDLRRRGVDIYTIQKVMGHKSIDVTTETYVHNEVGALKKGMKLKASGAKKNA